MKLHFGACVALVSLLAFVACQSPVNTLNSTSKSIGSGRVAVTFKTPARSVVADPLDALTKGTVTLTSHDGFDTLNLSSDSAVAFVDVAAGTWDVSVTAYAGTDEIGKGVLTDQVVTDGGSLELVIPITTSQTATGGYSLSFTVPIKRGIDHVSAQLYTVAGVASGSPIVPTLTSSGDDVSGTIAQAGVASGAYRLKLTFRRGGATGTVVKVDTEAVNVFDNLNSNLWLDSAGDLQDSKAYLVEDFAVIASKAWRGTEDLFVWDSATDGNGNLWVLVETTLSPTSALDFGAGVSVTGSSDPSTDYVIVKFNSEGLAQWALPFNGGEYGNGVSGIDVDAEGNLFAVGGFYETLLIGSSATGGESVAVTTTTTGESREYEAFLVKYNDQGKVVWSQTVPKTAPGSEGSWLFDVKVIGTDLDQKINVVGSISGDYVSVAQTYAFGESVEVTGSLGMGGVVAQYDSTGVAQWARSQSLSDPESALWKLTLDAAGNIYVVGGSPDGGNITFDGSTVTVTVLSESSFLVKFDTAGVAQWARALPYRVISNSIAADSSGSFYLAGQSEVAATLGNSVSIINPGAVGLPLLVKFDTNGVAQWARTASGEGAFQDLAVGPTGDIHAVGEILGTSGVFFGEAISGATVTGVFTDKNAVLLTFNSEGAVLGSEVATLANAASEFWTVCTDAIGNVWASGLVAGSSTINFGGGRGDLVGLGTGQNLVAVQYTYTSF